MDLSPALMEWGTGSQASTLIDPSLGVGDLGRSIGGSGLASMDPGRGARKPCTSTSFDSTFHEHKTGACAIARDSSASARVLKPGLGSMEVGFGILVLVPSSSTACTKVTSVFGKIK